MSRTIVISDTHMPRRNRVASARLLEPLLGACDRLLVNGDLAETHKQELIEPVEREIRLLLDLSERAGTELLLLAGNHDPELSPWRAAEFGEGRIVVTHGDAFQSNIAPWAREAAVMHEEWERIRELHPGEETIESRFDSVRGAAIVEWGIDPTSPGYSTVPSLMLRPGAVLRILQQWRRFPELARRFAQAFFPRADWMVVGHCHRNGISRSRRPGVINTGAFGFPTSPLAVILEGDELEVRRLARGTHGWTVEGTTCILREEVPHAERLCALHGPPEERPPGGRHMESAQVTYPTRTIRISGDDEATTA
ncbi:MAG: metallophosphoesterase family protein [Phycisphaerales bacterium]|nr:metallophosphoesterase family protein [Phycisphaerales bacterium]